MINLTKAIYECLGETMETDVSGISISDDLAEAGLDSFKFVKFIVLLEKKLDFTLNDSDLIMEYFSTIEKAIERLKAYKFKEVESISPKLIKCIALDCDNVLWGGIATESGKEGVQLGQSEIGLAYQDFQREIMRLHAIGILISLCSKNDEADIWEIFDNHPYMILKREHITAYRINWENKTENLLSLADELNLGLDSFLFIDDSQYETEQVRFTLPLMPTLRLNPERPHEYITLLRNCLGGMTSVLPGRASLYLDQKAREKSKEGFINIDDYHRSLETVVTVEYAKQSHIPRIVEISERTNQFNLTNKRYNEKELKDMLSNPVYDVLTLSAADRFGDMGMICVAIARYVNGSAHIESFFLSCRAFGRSFEQVMLSQLFSIAKAKKLKQIWGYYYPTDKNKRYSGFWNNSGFIQKNRAFFSRIRKINYPDIFREIEVIP